MRIFFTGRPMGWLILLALLPAARGFAEPSALTLEMAVQQALERSPGHRAAESAIQASRESALQAGQLPDPMLKLGIDNLPVEGPDRWSLTRDFMTMRRIGIEQQWVSSTHLTPESRPWPATASFKASIAPEFHAASAEAPISAIRCAPRSFSNSKALSCIASSWPRSPFRSSHFKISGAKRKAPPNNPPRSVSIIEHPRRA